MRVIRTAAELNVQTLTRLVNCRLRLGLECGNVSRDVSLDSRVDWFWFYRLRNRNAWNFES
jgi:hypothetical protein